MDATVWRGGGQSGGVYSTYGVRVGAANRDRYFSPSWNEVEIEINGSYHRLPITPGFWNKCPEIRGSAIKEWLRGLNLLRWPKGSPPELDLLPLDGRRFRLQLKRR